MESSSTCLRALQYAQKLSRLIAEFDKLIFKEHQYKVKIVKTLEERKRIEEAIFSELQKQLSPKLAEAVIEGVINEEFVREVWEYLKDKFKEMRCGTLSLRKGERYYVIVPENLIRSIISDISWKKHFLARKLQKLKVKDEKELWDAWEKMPSFTEEEVIVAYAAHEVRHRVQSEYSINLITQESAKKTVDLELRLLILFLPSFYRAMIDSSLKGLRLEIKREFLNAVEIDAIIIEWLIARLWHEGERDLSKLAEILKEDGERLIKKRDLIPSLFYFRRF